MVRTAYLLPALILSGCVTHEVREVPVPIKPPTLCVTDCPAPEGIPQTNGELALQWRERGEALACYAARMQCIREVSQ
jgi:hypothetical protein